MPDYNLLILPILGAYYLITRTHLFYYEQQQLDRQRLIFTTFLFSAYLLIISFTLGSIFKYIFPEYSYLILSNIPIKQKWIGTCLLSFPIAIVFSWTINRFYGKAESLFRAVTKYGDVFQNLLLSAFTSKELIMITLKNNKVYVGFIDSFPPSGSLEMPYFDLTPMLSGHRDEDHNLKFTTDYFAAYEKLGNTVDEEEGQFQDLENIVITIKTEEMLSASPFNPELYETLNPN